MLASYERADSFLEKPAVGAVPDRLGGLEGGR